MIDAMIFNLQDRMTEAGIAYASIGKPEHLWSGHRFFRIELSNGWTIQCGYDTVHRSNGVDTVEVSLINPNGFWKPQRFKGTENGVWPDRTEDQVLKIVEFMFKKE